MDHNNTDIYRTYDAWGWNVTNSNSSLESAAY